MAEKYDLVLVIDESLTSRPGAFTAIDEQGNEVRDWTEKLKYLKKEVLENPESYINHFSFAGLVLGRPSVYELEGCHDCGVLDYHFYNLARGVHDRSRPSQPQSPAKPKKVIEKELRAHYRSVLVDGDIVSVPICRLVQLQPACKAISTKQPKVS